MSTAFEAEDIDRLLAVVKAAHQAVANAGAKRIITTLKIDDRKDKDVSMESKLKALE
jgi:uncharacterized protein (TIGR00106 family)